MIFYDTPHLIIRWDETLRCVYLEWRGFVKGDDFRNGLDKALELVRLKEARRWLADLRDERVIPLEDQRWFAEDWFPRVEASTVRFMAVLPPENTLGQMSVDNTRTQLNTTSPITIIHFETLEQAQQWLQSC